MSESAQSRSWFYSPTFLITTILCVYWVVLFYSTHTKLPPGILPGYSDKAVHFAAYGLLGALLMALRASRGPFPWTSIMARWVVLAMYGAFDELTQLLVNRNADFQDWFADIIGAAIGLGLVTVISRAVKRRGVQLDDSLANAVQN
jgi:VanZ family protein